MKRNWRLICFRTSACSIILEKIEEMDFSIYESFSRLVCMDCGGKAELGHVQW